MRYVLEFDQLLARFFAGLQGHSAIVDRLFGFLFDLPTYKTYPFIMVGIALWFAHPDRAVRQKLIATGLGGALAMILTHLLQWAAPERLRPIQTGDYPFVWGRIGLDASSFPSDTMGISCAMALGIWSVSRAWGIVAFAWAIILVAGGKLFSGQHYFSDILVGAVIGLASTALFLRSKFPERLDGRLNAVETRWPTAFYLLFFFAALQLSTLFVDMRLSGNALLSRAEFDSSRPINDNRDHVARANTSVWTGA